MSSICNLDLHKLKQVNSEVIIIAKKKEPNIIVRDHFKSKTEEELIENVNKIIIKYINL